MTAATANQSSAVIGVHDGHNAAAAIVRNGVVELALQEERFTRIKNQGDAPSRAIQVALQHLGPEAQHATIALNGLYMNYGQWRRETIIEDYAASSRLRSRWKQPLKSTFVDRAYRQQKNQIRRTKLAEAGLSPDKQVSVEHHLAHASAAYYTNPWPSEKTLVVTCDGSGDRLAATVNIGDRRDRDGGKLTRIAQVSEHDSIGRLYALVTRWLGMAPLEHEYKVMGLAPYVSAERGAIGLRDCFSQLFEFSSDGLSWRRKRGVPSMYSAYDFISQLLSSQRFDLVAAGVQAFLEQILVRWITSAIRETGISRVACSGGVFMNVKANLALLEIPELDALYIVPSCGDESNSIGAACQVAVRQGQRIQPLGPLYYGAPITDSEVEQALRTLPGESKVRARFCANIACRTAEALTEGKIVARAAGALEFGARALGNRSILARADCPSAVRMINQSVKNRDFWMPFAPSVLAERAGDYYFKPKPVDSPHMMLAFHSRPEKRAAFSAAQHPYDFTTRPHEARAEHNPGYYAVLKEYEMLTGEGILLNTSFNLHGEPIVFRASDALDVFLRSGLNCMALSNWWIEKAA